MSLVTAYKVSERDRSLIEEFGRNPLTHQSKDLQRLLNRFHGEPVDSKFVLVCTKPHREWMIGRLSGRGLPVKIFKYKRFTSLRQAEWEVFKLWWERQTSSKLE